MIPLISSLCYGPSEVCQLPRFWWKNVTCRAGILDAEYPDCSGGLDAGVLEVLELDRDRTQGWIRENMPSYLEFEAWVVAEKKGDLDAVAVEKWNESIRSRVHTRPEKITETYRDVGLEEGKCTETSAVILNAMQDWQLFYKRDLESGFPGMGGCVVPLIATIDYGMLRMCQLPRTWLKLILHAKGLLHPDYPEMTEDGLDPRVFRLLNIDIDRAKGYIREELPSYLVFEGWVEEQTDGEINRSAVEEWNDYLRNRIHRGAKRAGILETIAWNAAREPLTSAVVLNHVEDWHLAHQLMIKPQG